MTSPRFTPRQLAAFVAAAELANFTGAARRLNLTPSAISALISELETSLGFSLFERTTRKIALTTSGRAFLPSALAVQRQLTLAAETAQDIRGQSTEIVRIAAPIAVASILLPPMIAVHQTKHPRSKIRIVDTPVEWLVDRVIHGEADLALGPDRPDAAETTRTPVLESPFVIWCAPGHPLAQRKSLRWKDLAETDIFAAGRDHDTSVQETLQPTEIVQNITTALGLAAAGLGVTFAPAYVGPLAAALGLTKCKLTEPSLMRRLTLYEMASSLAGPATAFRDTIMQERAAFVEKSDKKEAKKA
jgi:DNA-binding transcriptional LysR family regulator